MTIILQISNVVRPLVRPNGKVKLDHKGEHQEMKPEFRAKSNLVSRYQCSFASPGTWSSGMKTVSHARVTKMKDGM